jgi:hypothetical protein
MQGKLKKQKFVVKAGCSNSQLSFFYSITIVLYRQENITHQKPPLMFLVHMKLILYSYSIDILGYTLYAQNTWVRSKNVQQIQKIWIQKKIRLTE